MRARVRTPDIDAVPLYQAIYPTVIIVLVALNRSYMERGLTQHLKSFPTPHIAPTVRTVATRLHESRSQGRPDVLPAAISERPEEHGCGEGLEHGCNTSRRTSEEWKVEGPPLLGSTLTAASAVPVDSNVLLISGDSKREDGKIT